MSNRCFLHFTGEHRATDHHLHNCISMGLCLLCQRSGANANLLRQSFRMVQWLTIIQRCTRGALCRRCFSASRSDGIFYLQFFSTGQDISQKHSLSFWWKVEGSGLRDLKIKVRNYPLVGGMEAVYTIWEGQTPPQGWQLAVIELSKRLCLC